MIVITSAAYVKPELQSELGLIPPSMLPLGNRRLYESQVSILRDAFGDEKIVLSLPQNYRVTEQDIGRLEQLAVKIELVPDSLSLSESLLYVINSSGCYSECLKILHGDTLIEQFPNLPDMIGISETHYDYDWEHEEMESSGRDLRNAVWCGFFSFSHTPLFARSLAISRGNFVQAVREYDAKLGLKKVYIDLWYDLGHTNTYYKSRSKRTTERAFNSIQILEGMVKKKGQNKQKIKAEYEWYKNVPWEIRQYTPQLLDYGNEEGQPYYILEYLPHISLNELYVYGEKSLATWERILNHCNSFLHLCESKAVFFDENNRSSYEKEAIDFLVNKTYDRLEQFARHTLFNLEKEVVVNNQTSPSIIAIVERCLQQINKGKAIISILHGDFCFSNILYDNRADQIKVIDPRGMTNFGNTVYGDIRYDLGKLCHSVVGLYDHIIAGTIDLKVNNNYNIDLNIFNNGRVKEIQRIFMSKAFTSHKIKMESVMPITILLFLSMLPLHSDDPRRQIAFLANAVRLYLTYSKIEGDG